MADHPQLLTQLLSRRNRLVEEISAAEALLRQHYETLQSIDHLIRLEDGNADLPPVPFTAKVHRQRVASTLVRGDVTRLCLEALREARGQILTTGQVVTFAADKRGLTFTSRRQQQDFASSVAMALARCHKRGLIEKAGTTSNRQGQWCITGK